MGTGLFLLMNRLFSSLAQSAGIGALGSFVTGFSACVVLLRVLRRKMKHHLEQRFQGRGPLVGGALGAVRMAGWTLGALTAGVLSPVQGWLTSHSFLAEVLSRFLGVEG
jgi:hypothetical protein